MKSCCWAWVWLLVMGTLVGDCGCGKSEQQIASGPEVIRMKLPQKVSSPSKVPASATVSQASVEGSPGGVANSRPSDTVAAEEGSQVVMLPDIHRIIYHPDGKIDPFDPLIKDEPTASTMAATKSQRKRRERQTPLERLDLSQLRLTAIIRTSSGYRALVEESTGKGYMIGVGTYMGLNGGKVVAIYKDRFVLEEDLEDAFGNVKTERREIKLPKPSGDPS